MVETHDLVSEVEWLMITAEEGGNRLDKVLTERYQEVRSRTYFHHLIAEGQVKLNGQLVKKRIKVRAGDEVEVAFLLAPELPLTAENIPLNLLYEDEHLLAVNKPPGMVVHPAPGNWTGTFVHALLYHCRELEFSGEILRPGIVHRLDKDTSGVLVAAKTVLAHQKLVHLFSTRQIRKEYLAICLGNPGEGEINAPIGRHPRQRQQMTVIEGGREAITGYRTLSVEGELSLVQLRLITGRTHQARVHLRHRGTPILGDMVYGSVTGNKRYGLNRQMLHAQSIQFQHPITGADLRLEAPLPNDMGARVIFFSRAI